MFKYDIKKLKDDYVIIKDYEPEEDNKLLVVPEMAKRNMNDDEDEPFGIYEVVQFSDSSEIPVKENLKIGDKIFVDKMYIDWDSEDFHLVREDGIVAQIVEE